MLKKRLEMMDTSQQKDGLWGRRCQQSNLLCWEVTQGYWHHRGFPAAQAEQLPSLLLGIGPSSKL